LVDGPNPFGRVRLWRRFPGILSRSGLGDRSPCSVAIGDVPFNALGHGVSMDQSDASERLHHMQCCRGTASPSPTATNPPGAAMIEHCLQAFALRFSKHHERFNKRISPGSDLIFVYAEGVSDDHSLILAYAKRKADAVAACTERVVD
jgi:hypothetical protein